MTQADNTKPWQNRLGTSVGSIWGLKSLGLYQTQAEIDAAPLPISETPRLGDIRYLDYNGDGLISWDDEVKIARPTTPEMMFSLMADANWKGFDLSVQLQDAPCATSCFVANGITVHVTRLHLRALSMPDGITRLITW